MIKTEMSNLEEAEEVVYQIIEEECPDLKCYDVPLEDYDNCLIEVNGVRYVIPELDLFAREGEFLSYDEESDTYMPDFSVTLLYELDEKDAKNFLYWEQDGLLVTLYNYLQSGKRMDYLSSLECRIELEIDDSLEDV